MTDGLPTSPDRPSVVIAAFNEEALIAKCLTALTEQSANQPVQVIVSANGCTDRTAEIAGTYDITVLDRSALGKAGALNAGDALAIGYPRIYLDADIIVPPHAINSLVEALHSRPHVLAAGPERQFNIEGRPWLVRAYFRVNERLPAFRDGLFGRGLIVLSESGRKRFSVFPDILADDLFLDSLYEPQEKIVVENVTVVVETPYTTRGLINRLVRVRRGNAALRAAAASGEVSITVRPADRLAWLREVLMNPRLLLPGIAYAGITLIAAWFAKKQPDRMNNWGREESTRS